MRIVKAIAAPRTQPKQDGQQTRQQTQPQPNHQAQQHKQQEPQPQTNKCKESQEFDHADEPTMEEAGSSNTRQAELSYPCEKSLTSEEAQQEHGQQTQGSPVEVVPEPVRPRRRTDGFFSTIRWIMLFLSAKSHEPHEHKSHLSPASMQSLTAGLGADVDTRPINILCLDGGGMKGRNLMVMVAEMEAMTGMPISSLFDLVGGTSVGGCGAIFLSKFGDDACSKAKAAMSQLQHKCFRHRSLGRLLQRGHLCRDRRRQLLIDICGRDTRLDRPNGGVRAFAVASREGNKGLEPFLFRTYEIPENNGMGAPAAANAAVAESTPSTPYAAAANSTSASAATVATIAAATASTAEASAMAESAPASVRTATTSQPLPGTNRAKLWQALLATSAAPLFFPRFRHRGDFFADGGLVANNPTLLALREARSLWPTRPIGLVLSLGSGAPAVDDIGRPLGFPSNAKLMRALRLIEDPEASNRLAAFLKQSSPSANFVRLQPPVHGVSFFEHDEEKLAKMERETCDFFRNSQTMQEVCAQLAESRLSHRRSSEADAAGDALRVAFGRCASIVLHWWVLAMLSVQQEFSDKTKQRPNLCAA